MVKERTTQMTKRYRWKYFLQGIDEKGKLWKFMIIDSSKTGGITRYINRNDKWEPIPFFIMQHNISRLCKKLNEKTRKEQQKNG